MAGEKSNLIATLVIGGIGDKQLEKYHAMADKVTAEAYSKNYLFAAQQKKKDECIQDLVNAGTSRSEATSFCATSSRGAEVKRRGERALVPRHLQGTGAGIFYIKECE